jgi:hypothetical protein
MTPRTAVVLLAALAALTPAGCRRAGSSSAASKAASATVPAAAAPAGTDYRTLSKSDLESLIQSKTGSGAVSLVPNGSNRYTGTIASPDGTSLPVVVTVEAERIVCETNTPAGSTRNIITPTGVKSDLNVK